MKTKDIVFLKLLPEFMQKDIANKSLSESINTISKDITKTIQLIQKWNKINELGHDDLDELARDLNIAWYDSRTSIQAKRSVILQSDMVFQKLGTKWAVESLLTAYYGEAYIEEWWEYGADPHHFKVFTTNPEMIQSDPEQFYRFLKLIKRESSVFDGISAGITGDAKTYVGLVYQEHSHEQYTII